MLNPANRQMTSAIVENSAMFGVPVQLTGSFVIFRSRRMVPSGPKSLL
jgi:hypothetical protein